MPKHTREGVYPNDHPFVKRMNDMIEYHNKHTIYLVKYQRKGFRPDTIRVESKIKPDFIEAADIIRQEYGGFNNNTDKILSVRKKPKTK